VCHPELMLTFQICCRDVVDFELSRNEDRSPDGPNGGESFPYRAISSCLPCLTEGWLWAPPPIFYVHCSPSVSIWAFGGPSRSPLNGGTWIPSRAASVSGKCSYIQADKFFPAAVERASAALSLAGQDVSRLVIRGIATATPPPRGSLWPRGSLTPGGSGVGKPSRWSSGTRTLHRSTFGKR
jgi:hypothetical protein